MNLADEERWQRKAGELGHINTWELDQYASGKFDKKNFAPRNYLNFSLKIVTEWTVTEWTFHAFIVKTYILSLSVILSFDTILLRS